MPRPNPPRDIRGEAYLAARVRLERTKRGWTPEQLAKAMTEHGCPIQTSAIYKIEGNGRRITVDELLGFSLVFGIDISDLVIDPKLVISAEVAELLDLWIKATEIRAQVVEHRRGTELRLAELLKGNSEAEAALREHLAAETDFLSEHPAILTIGPDPAHDVRGRRGRTERGPAHGGQHQR